MVCNRDCFDCVYADCVQDELSDEDRQEIRNRDIKYGLVDERRSTRANAYYLNHQEEIIAKQKEYYRNNRERILASQKKRYADNRDAERERKRENTRRWRNAHKQQVNDSQ